MLSPYGTFPVLRFENIPEFCPFFPMTSKIPDPEFCGISAYFTSCLSSSFNDSIIYAFNSCTLTFYVIVLHWELSWCHLIPESLFHSHCFPGYCSSLFLIFTSETFNSPTRHFCLIMFPIVSKHLDLNPCLLEMSRCLKRLSLPWTWIKIYFAWTINNHIKISFFYSYPPALLLSLGYQPWLSVDLQITEHQA